MIAPLKLAAFDKDDLLVVSAHVQDAEVSIADIHWRPAEKCLVLALSRYDWEAPTGAAPQERRRLAALRFDRVLACKCREVKPDATDRMVTLVGIAFAENDAPGGVVTLMFACGGALRLEVECLEASLADLGPVSALSATPRADSPRA